MKKREYKNKWKVISDDFEKDKSKKESNETKINNKEKKRKMTKRNI